MDDDGGNNSNSRYLVEHVDQRLVEANHSAIITVSKHHSAASSGTAINNNASSKATMRHTCLK